MNTETSNFINYTNTKQNSDTINTSLFSLLKDCDIRISRLLELIERPGAPAKHFPAKPASTTQRHHPHRQPGLSSKGGIYCNGY